MDRPRQQLWALIGLFWVVIVLCAYYIFHKPFQPEEVIALANVALDVLSVALLVSVAGGLGRRLLVLLLRTRPMLAVSTPEKLALDTLAGLGVVSVGVLALAVAGLVNGALFLGLAVAALALLVRDALAWWRELSSWLRSGLRALGSWDAFLSLFVALMLLMAFINALAPPTKWDALVYHLTGPKLFIEAGRLHGEVNNHFLGFPQLTEMLYLWSMSWRGVATGTALIHWCFGVLMLALTGGLAARTTGNVGAGLVAAAILLTAETIWWEFTWAYADLSPMAFVIGGFVLLDQWRGKKTPRLLAAAGLMAGCALGAKYTAVGAAAGLGVLALWFARREGARTALRVGALLAVATMATFAPWLAKNVVVYGNPVYPFFFETAGWDAYRQGWYTRSGTGLLSTAPLRLLLLPWDATVCSEEGVSGYASPFGDALPLCDPAGRGALGATVGPLFLALIPLLAFGKATLSTDERGFLERGVLFLVVPYAVWLYGVAASELLEQTRLLLPVFPVLAILAAIALEAIRQTRTGDVRIGRVMAAAVVLVLALSLLSGTLDAIRLGVAPVLTGARTQGDFLYDTLGWHYAAMEAVNRLPDDAQVLFLWEPRTFYCRTGISCQPDALLDNWYHAMRITGGDIDAIAARWREAGISHILLWDVGMRRLTAPGADPFEPGDVEALHAFVERFLRPAWQGEMDGTRHYTLYRWGES